jgi:hemolysin type calcium-binding protein/WD40 repeat protein
VDEPRHRITASGASRMVLAVALLALALPPAAVAVTPGFEGKVAFQGFDSTTGDWDIWIDDARLPQCSDGVDNDGVDGTDLADLDCANAEDRDENEAGSDDGLRAPEPLPAADSGAHHETEPAWAGAGCGELPCSGTPATAGDAVTDLEQVLVFARAEDVPGAARDIYAAIPSVVTPQPLVQHPADDGSPAVCCGIASDRLAFDSNRTGNRDVYVAPLGTGAASCSIAATPLPEANPEWSPDGGQIAFERHGPDGAQVFVVDVGPGLCSYGNERLVTPDQPPSFEPTWFHWDNTENVPGGERAHRIAFRGPDDRPANGVYFVEHPYGDLAPASPFAPAPELDEGVLIDDGREHLAPSWTPYGAGAVFASDRGGGYDIWFVDANAERPPEPVGGTTGEDGEPAVQPLQATASVQGIRVCGRVCRKRRRRAPGRSVSTTSIEEPRRVVRCPGATAGDDVIRGTRGDDVLCGLGGDDTILGGRGDDTLRGGRGDDRLSGGPGRDRLFGETGRDRLRGGRGDDRLRGGPGSDRLLGEPGRDRLRGDSGRDGLFGGTGGDRLVGGAHRDRMLGQAGDDRLDARGGGSDLVAGGPGRDTALADRSDDLTRIERRRR